MMSNYDRTLQLIESANNSAGASQTQFEKTVESLESKLNRLKNAWNAYTMGLANNGIIKGAVDLLTQLITAINKITDVLPGPTKGFGKLAVAILGLKAGSAIFDSYFINLKRLNAPVAALGATFNQVFNNIFSRLSKLKALKISEFLFGSANFNKSKINSVTTAFNKLTAAQSKAAYASDKKRSLERILNEYGKFGTEEYNKTRDKYKALGLGSKTKVNVAIRAANTASGVANEEAIAALNAYKEALKQAGISEVEFNAIQNAGLPIKTQAALLNDKEALAKVHDIMATEGLTEEEKKAQIQKVALNAQSKIGLVSRAKNLFLLLFTTKATRAQAAENLGLATSEEIATGTTHGLTAALLALPIGWVMIAVAALAAAFYVLWKAMEDADPNKQLKKAKEAAAEASEAVTKAKESVDGLKTGLDELSESYSNLQQLAQGTKDWNEAIIETNDKVLDLIDNYKELAKYVKNSNGTLVLDISSDEVQGVIKDYEQRAILARSAEAISKIEVEQKQLNVDYDNLKYEAKVKGMGYFKYEYNPYSGQDEKVAVSYEEYSDHLTQLDNMNYFKENGTEGNRKLTEALAIALAKGEVRRTSDDIENWLREQVPVNESDYSFEYWAKELEENSKELRNFGKKLILATSAEEVYRDSIINNAKEYGEISSLSYGDLINNLSDDIFEEKVKTKVEEKTNEILGRVTGKYLDSNDLNKFIQIKGGKYTLDGQKIIDTESGEEVKNLSNKMIAKELAAAEVTEELADDMKELDEVFRTVASNAGSNKAEELAALMSEEGTALNRKMIDAYIKSFTADNFNWDEFAQTFGSKNLLEMAEHFGMEVEDMADLIGRNLVMASDTLNNQRKKIIGNIKKADKSNIKTFNQYANELKNLEIKFDKANVDFYNVFNSISNALERAENEEVYDLGIKQFWDTANNPNINVNQVKAFESFVTGINWSDPIEAIYELNQEIGKGSGLTKDFALKMNELGDSAYDTSHQMSYMLMSTSFEDIQEDLDEIIAKNGEIATTDVYEIADSYKTLDKFMKNTGVTANGVAKALTLVNKGKIGINQLTNAVIAGISQFDSLDGIVDKVLKTFEDFDPGADENDVANFINDVYETLNENLEKGAVGNNQNFSYLDLLLGPQWREGLSGDELVTRMQQLTKKLGKNSQDMHDSWADLASGKDFYGNNIDKNILGNLSIIDNGQKITLAGYEGMTTAQIIEAIQKAYNVSETYAEAMLADFKNYSGDLAIELQKNDVIAAIDTMYKSANKINNSVTIIDENEIRALAAAFGTDFDYVKNELEKKGALITNFYDKDGILKSSTELANEIREILVDDLVKDGNHWYDKFVDSFDLQGNINLLDYEGMQQTLNDLTIPKDQWAEATQAMVDKIRIESGQTTIGVKYQLSNGEFTTLTITPDIDVNTAMHNAETKLKNDEQIDVISQAISKAFGEIEIIPSVDKDNLAELHKIIYETISGDACEIKIKTIDDNIEEVKKEINEAILSKEFTIKGGFKKQQLENTLRNLNLTAPVTLVFSRNGQSEVITNHAAGIRNANKAHKALIAEEGPELVQTENGAYLAKTPQIARINKNDTVYTAQETKQILRGNNISKIIPRYRDGRVIEDFDKESIGTFHTVKVAPTAKKEIDISINSVTISSINDESDSYNKEWNYNKNADADDADKPDLWENPYDWLYNLTEEINENLRERNNLEKKFQILQKRGRTSAEVTSKYYDEQFRLLKENYDLEEDMYTKRKQEMKDFLNLEENKDLKKYGIFNFDKMQIELDWDKINKLDNTENTEEGERIEEYISKLEEIQEAIEDAEEAMLDAALSTEELKEELRNTYLEFEDRVANALEQIDRNEVDGLKQVYDAVTSADDDLLSAIRDQISEYRQARDNKETEEDIAKKERRLAYMRQDTSGSNKNDILKLEDEVEKARQQYQDKLVDQALENLQTQQEYAAQQRDKQIELMESQIKWNLENGTYVKQVSELLKEAYKNDNFLTEDDELYKVLSDGEGWGKESDTKLGSIIKEMQNQADTARTAQEYGLNSNNDNDVNKDTDVNGPNTDYMAKMQREYAAAGGKMTNKIYELNAMRNNKISNDQTSKYNTLNNSQIEEELKRWWDNGGKDIYKQSNIDSAGNDLLDKVTNSTSSAKTSTTTTTKTDTTSSTTTTTKPIQTTDFSVGDFVRVSKNATFVSGATMSGKVREAGVISGKPGAFKILKDNGNGNYFIGRSWTSDGVTGLINKKWLTAYAKGGLADFTGPAWLDGTPSKPEVVLNARDSANFFQLRDILRESLNGATSIQHSGDTYQYDIDINNPQIASDYDVDEMIRRVEEDVYNKSMYRNINAIKRLR